MFKKFLITSLLVTVLFGLGSFFSAPQVLATTPTTTGALQGEGFQFDLGVVTHKDIKEANWIKNGINFVFSRIITILAATVGAAAVMMMAFGGFLMISSAGNQERYDKGKGLIWKAVIGLVFVLGAYILVTTVQLLIKSVFS